MSVHPPVSVLWPPGVAPAGHEEADAIFPDLNLGALFEAALAGRERYDLRPLFSEPLASAEAIRYRQEVVRDLEGPAVREAVDRFAGAMADAHVALERAEQRTYRYQRLVGALAALLHYGDAVEELARALPAAGPGSAGLRALGVDLAAYVAGPGFRSRLDAARAVDGELAGVAYALRIDGTRIGVETFTGEADYSVEVERTFARFRQRGTKEYRFRVHGFDEFNHVEEEIFDHVVALFPAPFSRVETVAAGVAEFFDPVVLRFEREVQFLLSYLDLIAPLRAAGLAFAYPEVAPGPSEISVRAAFDLALAGTAGGRGAPVVPNDVRLSGPERVLVVTGPNQGGKTTFARSVGQLCYLARLGVPVPGEEARLPLCDRVFTLFDRAERPEELQGKLEEELHRAREILGTATAASVIVLNESFSSTSLSDAVFLGRKVLGAIIERGARAVYVTFADELATVDPAAVSVVAQVRPDDPTVRTFRVIRAAADGRAFATAIAAKYGLSYAQLAAGLPS